MRIILKDRYRPLVANITDGGVGDIFSNIAQHRGSEQYIPDAKDIDDENAFGHNNVSLQAPSNMGLSSSLLPAA